jgi:beta-lactamase superfamily II metal-dependent hydrolase
MKPFRWLCLLSVVVSCNVLAGRSDGTLDIYWVDSMGGGSTLIVTPDDESILIDTGNPGGRDAGRIHQVATEVAGLKQIDHLIVTHFHIDHYGGAPELAALMPIRTVYDNGIPERDPDGRQDLTWPQRIRAYRDMPVGSRQVVEPGQTISLRRIKDSPELQFTIVAARQRVLSKADAVANAAVCAEVTTKPVDSSDNANSIATLLQFGAFRFFNGGDLTWNVEAKLVCPDILIEPVDVFQVNHHGLDVSNNPVLLRALAPVVAVFNNGPRKGAMPAVVESLKALPKPPALFQVHRNLRNPEVNAPDDRLANDGEPGGEYLLLKVSPNATTYDLIVPKPLTSHKFEVRR